jgi:hypothetical protein
MSACAPPATTGSSVTVRQLDAADHADWRELLAASPQGSVYALPEYLAALCEATGASFRILGAFLDGRLVAGVGLYERRTRAGPVVSNRSLLYYNGIVLGPPSRRYHAEETSQTQAVLAALERGLVGLGHAHVLLHNDASLPDLRPFLTRGWRPGLSYTYVVRLTDMDAQWERVDPNLKRLIRRCEREGVTYREDADFDALFRLHLQTHRRKGAPLYLPEADFRRLFERLHAQGLARLGHAVLEGRVIASQLMLAWRHPVSHTVCAGADEAYLRLGASGFLRWQALLALAREGYAANDLTDATPNPVTRFKSQLGGELTPTWSIERRGSWRHAAETTARRWREALAGRFKRGPGSDG